MFYLRDSLLVVLVTIVDSSFPGDNGKTHLIYQVINLMYLQLLEGLTLTT